MRLLLAAVAALALGAPAATTAPDNKIDPKPQCKHVTAKAFGAFSGRAWRLSAWERGKPPGKVIRAQRHKLKCAAGPGHLKAMQKRWRADKRAYNQHRAAKYAEQRAREQQRREVEALTPYDCGSAGRFAIPCYIVSCESGYSWGAYNPSGAAGPYQIMPEHGRPFPIGGLPDKVAHHRIASTLWAGGDGAGNWVCA
jgi:hypothetical protein